MQIAGMSIDLRLREARIRAGFKTAAAAARHLRVPYGTYSGHESGSRGIKGSEILKYAEAFSVSEAWLTFGDISKPENKSVIVVLPGGLVGDSEDGRVNWMPWSQKGPEETKKTQPWERHATSALSVIDYETFKYVVPAIPMMGDYLASILVSGYGIEALAEHGSVIYFKKDLYEFGNDYLNLLCLCFIDGQESYIAKPVLSEDGETIKLVGPKRTKILKNAPKYVMPIWAILSPHARTEVLQQLSDGLRDFVTQQTARR